MIRLLLEQPAVGESGQILVRSKLRAVSARMGFSDVQRERMELVCTEIFTNQLKHAFGNGMFQIWESSQPLPAIDIFALDHGPGIPDLSRAFQDGFTTSATMGKGLGAIGRLADESEVYSVYAGLAPGAPWHGVAVWARFYRDKPAAEARPGYRIGAFLRAYQDGLHNGDSICVHCADSTVRWLHMDGLGHGREAAEAVDSVQNPLDTDAGPEEILGNISAQLKGGRGAVGIIGEFDVDAAQVRVCGVGDMVAAGVGVGGKHNISFAPGVLGHAHRHFDTAQVPMTGDAVFITASDGIRRSWSEESFPGLHRLHPQMVALLLGNLVSRINDDKSVFVVGAAPPKGQ